MNVSTYVKTIYDKEEQETREQGSFELAHSFGPTDSVQVNETNDNEVMEMSNDTLMTIPVTDDDDDDNEEEEEEGNDDDDDVADDDDDVCGKQQRTVRTISDAS